MNTTCEARSSCFTAGLIAMPHTHAGLINVPHTHTTQPFTLARYVLHSTYAPVVILSADQATQHPHNDWQNVQQLVGSN